MRQSGSLRNQRAGRSRSSNLRARRVHGAVMSMSGDGSNEAASRVPEMGVSSDGALSATTLICRASPAQTRQRVFVVPVTTGPQPSPAEPRAVERIVHCHRCNSRVQDLKRSIELQIEEVARLIDDGRSAREATQLLNELTIELITAALGLWAKRGGRYDAADISSGAGRPIQDYRSVCDPEQLSVLGRIFADAVASLPEDMRTHRNRTRIAKLILGRAVIAEFELGLFIRLVVAVAAAV